MKAKQEISGIKVYSILPSKYKSENLNIAGGFHKLSTAIHEAEGFFEVEEPVFDYDIEERGEIYFDSRNRIFKYLITTKILPTLEEAKIRKIAELRNAVRKLYSSVQWYLEMLRANDEAIPVAAKTKIRQIKTSYDSLKAQINALTEVVSVIKFQIPYDAIATVQENLDEIV